MLTTGSVAEIEYGVDTEQSDPTFVKWIGNVTAPVGKDVTLQCSVQNVGNYKVSHPSSTSSDQSPVEIILHSAQSVNFVDYFLVET